MGRMGTSPSVPPGWGQGWGAVGGILGLSATVELGEHRHHPWGCHRVGRVTVPPGFPV